MTDWNPQLYMKFEEQRTRPARELADRVPLSGPSRIADAGCGPGNSTAVLRRKWPSARITGFDSSRAMIEEAKRAYPQGDWLIADLQTWGSGPEFDLIFSNAVLQWLSGHDTLLPHLMRSLKPGGVLAVQIPANSESPLHRETMALAESAEWKTRWSGPVRRLNYRPPADYYDILSPFSAGIDIWETEYGHVMEGPEDLLSWYESTGLRPVMDVLPGEELKARFRNELLERIRDAYPRRPDGKVLFPFRRLFFVAVRKD